MSIRTKVLVTIATVATMTAIGTTKAYGLENNNASVNSLENMQISIDGNDISTNDIKDKSDNLKDKINAKKEIIKNPKEENILEKKEKTTKEKEINLKQEQSLNNEENKKISNSKKANDSIINGQSSLKATKEEEVDKKQKEQSLNKKLKSDKNNDSKVKLEENKTRNIVKGKIVNTISKVNVRKYASLDSIIIGQLSLGENVTVDKNNSNSEWYGICFRENGGFVSIKHIEIEEPTNKEEKHSLEVKQNKVNTVLNATANNDKNNIVEGEVIDLLSKLNVRENPSLDSVVIGQLSSNEKVKIDKNHSTSEWYGICFGEHGGFVSAKYVKLPKAIVDDKHEDKKDDNKKEENKDTSADKEQGNFVLGQVINVVSHLNVREKPTTKGEIIGKIYEGNQVLINKAKSPDGWYEIAFGSNGGYVSANYIKTIKQDYLITNGLVKFVASYEGYSATPYRGADYQNRTIGYGHVIMSGETYDYLTEPEARNLLKSDLNVTAHQVKNVLNEKGIKLNTHQFDSLVSFAYNCGVQGLSNSRLLRDIKNKTDLAEIKDAFLAWRYCNGIELEGLRRRRVEEFEIYSKGDYIRDLI